METTHVALGMTLSLVSGIFLGSFAVPMKKVKSWQWENTWIMYSLWGTVLLPVLFALFTVPDLWHVYANVSPATLLIVFGFGAGWGFGNVGFGLGIKMVGLALGTAIILGLNNAVGSILPLIIYHPEELDTPAGMAIIAGVAVMIVGILICARAGTLREKAQQTSKSAASGTDKNLMIKGLILCFVTGIVGSSFNFALIEGKPLEQQAMLQGATQLNAANATWCISLFGGFVITLVYVIYLFATNKSFALFANRNSGVNWLLTFLMGGMWFGGVALYGMAVMNLGKIGVSMGWPVIQSMAVASGNVLGIVTGEWKSSGKRPLQIMIIGLLFLFTGIAVIGWSSTLK